MKSVSRSNATIHLLDTQIIIFCCVKYLEYSQIGITIGLTYLISTFTVIVPNVVLIS